MRALLLLALAAAALVVAPAGGGAEALASLLRRLAAPTACSRGPSSEGGSAPTDAASERAEIAAAGALGAALALLFFGLGALCQRWWLARAGRAAALDCACKREAAAQAAALQSEAAAAAAGELKVAAVAAAGELQAAAAAAAGELKAAAAGAARRAAAAAAALKAAALPIQLAQYNRPSRADLPAADPARARGGDGDDVLAAPYSPRAPLAAAGACDCGAGCAGCACAAAGRPCTAACLCVGTCAHTRGFHGNHVGNLPV